jgi:hypothetical protein
MADKLLRTPRKLKTETHKQLKIRTDMNSDAPYESAVRISLIPPGLFSKLCSNNKKKSLWFQSIHLSKYPYTLG